MFCKFHVSISKLFADSKVPINQVAHLSNDLIVIHNSSALIFLRNYFHKGFVYIITAPPAFTSRKFSEELFEGDSKKVTVRFTGIPTPDCEWRLGDTPVRGVQVDTTSTFSSMHIKHANRKKHSGAYTVTLKNKSGVATINGQITVLG